MNNRNKLISIVITTLIIGLFFGWLFFGGNNQPKKEPTAPITENVIWTCSMDPQIRQNEPGKCPICGMDLIPLATDNSHENPAVIQMTKTAMKLANIQTMIVGNKVAVKEVRLNGKVQVDERNVYMQTSHIEGRVEQLMVNFTGEAIQKGKVLAILYSPELVTAQEELFQAFKIKESQPELYQAARGKLKSWKLTENQISKILANGKPIERFPIIADVSGIAIQKKVNLGEYVMRGTPIYEIADLSKLWILLDVYESDLPFVKVGDQVSYTIASLPGETFSGKVSFIDPMINPETRVASARIELKNISQKLKPEMFVTGIIKNEVGKMGSKNQIVVPKSAVMWTGERSIVYIKVSETEKVGFVLREVVLGPSLGESYVITAGLNEGEEIVINGTFTVDAAAQLAGKPSMMNREGGATSVGHQHGNEPQLQQEKQTPKSTISSEAKKQLEPLINEYIALKEALSKDDFSKAKQQLNSMKIALSKVNMKVFTGESHNLWMQFQDEINSELTKLDKVSDIEKIRKSFLNLSKTYISLVESFGPFSKKSYLIHCPMANNNKGGDWLSFTKEVKNPYYGKSMLSCGSVKKEY